MAQIVAAIFVTAIVAIVVRVIYISRKFRYPEKDIRDARQRLAAGRFM